MLLEGGYVDTIGNPSEVARRYHELMRRGTNVSRQASAGESVAAAPLEEALPS